MRQSALCAQITVVLLSLAFGGPWGPRAAAAAPPAPAGATPAVSPAQPPAPADVTGASVIEYDARTQQYTFRGRHVVIVQGAQRVEATEILYSAAGRRVSLPQGGTVSSPVMVLSAQRLLADLISRHIEAEGKVVGEFLDEGVWTSLAASRVVADDRPDQRHAEAVGNVVAVRQDEELHGDRIVYDRSTQHAAVEGHAVLRRGQDTLRADRVDVDLDAREARAVGHVLLDRVTPRIHAAAEEAAYSARTETAMLAGHPVVTRDRDSLAADQLSVRLGQGLVAADGHVQIVAYQGEPEP